MVEKGDSGIDGIFSGSVEIEAQVDLGLAGIAFLSGGSRAHKWEKGSPGRMA